MSALEDLGARVKDARVQQRWTLQAAAKAANIARDTWAKVEKGQSVHDVKRSVVLEFLGLDEQGFPKDVGGNTQDPGYVAAPGDTEHQPVTNEQLLAEIRAMREDHNALSRRVARLESSAQPVGGLDGPV